MDIFFCYIFSTYTYMCIEIYLQYTYVRIIRPSAGPADYGKAVENVGSTKPTFYYFIEEYIFRLMPERTK